MEPINATPPTPPDRYLIPPTIRALGPLTINGHDPGTRSKPWKYTKTAELVLYLALHPQGATADEIMEALWPGQPTNRPRLNQHISDARRKALGGERWLPAASSIDPRYRISPDVTLDLATFARLIHTDAPGSRQDNLTDALALVAGRPLAVPGSGYAWLGVDAAVAEARVQDIARELIDLATTAGDHRLAMWAADRALLVWAEDQDFIVAHGRAAVAVGDPAGIARAVAMTDTIPTDELLPETAAAVDTIRRGAIPAT